MGGSVFFGVGSRGPGILGLAILALVLLVVLVTLVRLGHVADSCGGGSGPVLLVGAFECSNVLGLKAEEAGAVGVAIGAESWRRHRVVRREGRVPTQGQTGRRVIRRCSW